MGGGAGLTSETDEQRRWDWAGFCALPGEPVTVELPGVTHWSKLATSWEGVSLDTLGAGVETSAGFARISCYGGDSANLPLEDLTRPQGLDRVRLRRPGAGAGAWRPGAAAGPPPVVVEARQVGAGLRLGTPTSRASGSASATMATATLAAAAVLGDYGGRWHDRLGPVERRHHLAGPLHDLLGVEVTTAVGRCSQCGRSAAMAEMRVFDHAPAWSPAARCATRSCCGWSATAAAPGWTDAA